MNVLNKFKTAVALVGRKTLIFVVFSSAANAHSHKSWCHMEKAEQQHMKPRITPNGKFMSGNKSEIHGNKLAHVDGMRKVKHSLTRQVLR